MPHPGEYKRYFPKRESTISDFTSLNELIQLDRKRPPQTIRHTLKLGEGKMGDGGILDSLKIGVLSPKIMEMFDLKPDTECQLIDTDESHGLPNHLVFVIGKKGKTERIAFNNAVTTIDLEMGLNTTKEQFVNKIRIGGVIRDDNGRDRILGITYDKIYNNIEAIDISLTPEEESGLLRDDIYKPPLFLKDNFDKTAALITRKMLEITGNPRSKLSWIRREDNGEFELNAGIVKRNVIEEIKRSYDILVEESELKILLNGKVVKTISSSYL